MWNPWIPIVLLFGVMMTTYTYHQRRRVLQITTNTTTTTTTTDTKEEDAVVATSQKRSLLIFDPKSTESKHSSQLSDNFWCNAEPDIEPLPYNNCNFDDIVYRIPLHGGMTNALKMVLLAVMKAFEEHRCFFIDESQSHLNNFDKTAFYENGFYARYFERIGHYNENPNVQRARRENRIRTLTWQEVWAQGRYRRMYDQVSSIPCLGYENIPGHELKAIMLRRMWRPKPEVRAAACQRMYDLVGHNNNNNNNNNKQPFLAMNIRRGDKDTEKSFRGFTSMDTYIEAAEEVMVDKFQIIPSSSSMTIFVASDDCTVLPELRSKRPTWHFVSECDKVIQKNSKGFVLSDMEHWELKDYDEHYEKFFTELFAMYTASFWIGIAYTNVSWFVYFMRGGKMENFWLVDKPKGASFQEAMAW